MRAAIGVAITLALSATAVAQERTSVGFWMDHSSLAQMCNDEDKTDCHSYLVGLYDGMLAESNACFNFGGYEGWGTTYCRQFCIPSGTTASEIAEAFIDHTRMNISAGDFANTTNLYRALEGVGWAGAACD